MPRAAILSLATGVPRRESTARGRSTRCWRRFSAPTITSASIFEHAGIECRHGVVDATYYAQERGTEERNRRYMSEAVPLAARTVRRCLQRRRARAGRGGRPAGGVLHGHRHARARPAPGRRARHAAGPAPDLCVGHGVLRRAARPAPGPAGGAGADKAPSRAGPPALLVAVELCSLHFQPEDRSLENVVASALFADGAAAVLLESEPAASEGRASGLRQRRPSPTCSTPPPTATTAPSITWPST